MFKITLNTIKGVIEGITNIIIVKEEVEKVKAERIAICRACPSNSENAKRDRRYKNALRPDEHCVDCGCNLEIKTSALAHSCESEKWLAVTDQPTEEAIQKAINSPQTKTLSE